MQIHLQILEAVMGWKERFKESAQEALGKLETSSRNQAHDLLKELSDGLVIVTVDNDSLRVKGTLTKQQRARIAALKADILSILGSGEKKPVVKQWPADSLAIQVSLSSNGITDFVIAPKVDGMGVPLMTEMAAILLAGSSPEWRSQVEKLGGLNVYSMSQWETAKPRLEGVL